MNAIFHINIIGYVNSTKLLTNKKINNSHKTTKGILYRHLECFDNGPLTMTPIIFHTNTVQWHACATDWSPTKTATLYICIKKYSTVVGKK